MDQMSRNIEIAGENPISKWPTWTDITSRPRVWITAATSVHEAYVLCRERSQPMVHVVFFHEGSTTPQLVSRQVTEVHLTKESALWAVMQVLASRTEALHETMTNFLDKLGDIVESRTVYDHENEREATNLPCSAYGNPYTEEAAS